MKRIAIIAGADSSEREVSINSARCIAESLDTSMYLSIVLVLEAGVFTSLEGVNVDMNTFTLLGQPFDYALITVHGAPGENGILQGYFELLNIPYSGCNVEASAVTFNKYLSKQLVQNIPNLHLAKEIIIAGNDCINSSHICNSLQLPLFVKPNASGSSCGVSKVKIESELNNAVKLALKESLLALAEECIDGVEISQGVMILDQKEFVMPITELLTDNEFFDYDAKYTKGKTTEITPARINENLTEIVSQISLDIYKKMNLRGIARIDYIIKNDKPYFIEVNTNPGMSKQSIVPQQWMNIGLTMGHAWGLIIENDLKLHAKTN